MSVKVDVTLSLFEASLLEAALPFSNSWILMLVVSILRRDSREWLRMKLSVNSLRKGNLDFMASTSLGSTLPPLEAAGSEHCPVKPALVLLVSS